MPKFGMLPSPPDHRDFIYASVVPTFGAELPRSFHYDRIVINNQVIGDCVGQSSRAVKVLQEGRAYDFAPDFIYSECKKIDGSPNTEGTYPKVAMQVLQKLGAARKGLYADLTSNTNRPATSADAYKDATNYTIGAYAKIQTLDEIKHALVTQGPVLLAIMVFENFFTAPGGVIPTPQGTIAGGHAICCDGYDDEKQQLRFVNSWGDSWGDGGYGYIGYDLLNWQADIGIRFFTEAWSSVDLQGPAPKPEAKTEIKLSLDSNQAIVNGNTVQLEQPPVIVNDRALVPIRFVAESLDCTVDFNASTREISIKQN